MPLDQTVRAICTISRDTSRLFESTGRIVLQDGSTAIEATGKYMKLPIDRIADGDFELEWFADDRPAQARVELP
ncbi:MAG: hypothetical protein Q7V14_04465 [Coriobacteriia bacterium]|nr:hypothetical protein [Coriobacteriia bacterium]MDO9108637.1 hypothetical protein [Coriobacteriia bacterium]